MAKKEYAVPIEIQVKIIDRIKAFNKKYSTSKKPCEYVPEFKGKFIYLHRARIEGSYENICRVTYNGDLEDMDFAIFKYSSEKYSVSEIFPGDEFIDGTIEGAMKAGLEAYPIEDAITYAQTKPVYDLIRKLLEGK